MTITLAIVVPVYSGDAYLSDLAEEVRTLRDLWAADRAPIALSRLVLVDDSAIDGSAAVADALADRYAWIEAVHLSRNFGQHPATIAGILHTEEDWVVTMDEDLQHPPTRIQDLIRKAITSSCDVVYGKPESRIHEAYSRDMTSRGFKRFIEWLTDNKNIRDVNSFRLIRGSIARGTAAACAHGTYFDVALSWFTQRVQTVVMPLKDLRYIATKKSGYRFRSLVSHARRLLVSSQIKALRMGAFFGFALAGVSVLVGLIVFLVWLFDPSAIAIRGWTSLMLAFAFFSGSILLMVGIVLEFISILLSRSNGRPIYFEVDRSGDEDLKGYFLDNVSVFTGKPKSSSRQN